MKLMKKELRKMKVVENFEEPFKRENTTYYVWNTEDNRSRMDNWRNDLKSKGFIIYIFIMHKQKQLDRTMRAACVCHPLFFVIK